MQKNIEDLCFLCDSPFDPVSGIKGNFNVVFCSKSCSSEYEDPNFFNWDFYLKFTGSTPASPEKFCQAIKTLTNKFKISQKLEFTDEKSGVALLATVVGHQGPRIRLRPDRSQKSLDDYWIMVDSSEIQPYGTASSQGKILQKPVGAKCTQDVWSRYVARTVESSSLALANAFLTPPLPPAGNLFLVGEKIEAQHMKNPRLVGVATIVDVKDDTVQIAFDGWSEEFNYECRFDSRTLFPVGWCKKYEHPIQHPGLNTKVPQKLSENLLESNKQSGWSISDSSAEHSSFSCSETPSTQVRGSQPNQGRPSTQTQGTQTPHRVKRTLEFSGKPYAQVKGKPTLGGESYSPCENQAVQANSSVSSNSANSSVEYGSAQSMLQAIPPAPEPPSDKQFTEADKAPSRHAMKIQGFAEMLAIQQQQNVRYTIHTVKRDGNSAFRAVAYGQYGYECHENLDGKLHNCTLYCSHTQIRQMVVSYVMVHFKHYEEDIRLQYTSKKFADAFSYSCYMGSLGQEATPFELKVVSKLLRTNIVAFKSVNAHDDDQSNFMIRVKRRGYEERLKAIWHIGAVSYPKNSMLMFYLDKNIYDCVTFAF